MDAQGYINIVGRLKEMVIRGGENIYPREIEELLIRHPKVADAQVLGVPDTFYGEKLLAVVLPKEEAEVSEEELRDFCEERISYQKIPRYFQFTNAFPMTASGKVWRDIDVLSNMIVTTKPCGFACHDTSETRPFGKRNAPRALITSLQIPFVMLRFILRKGSWLTPRGVALASDSRR